MVDLTIVVACYGQPLMMRWQIEKAASYSDEVRSRLNYVIVDDCGTPPMSLSDVELLANIVRSVKLFRVTQDIPWNQPGARNLGMHHSQGWCLMIDPDMVFDGPMMARMIQAAEKMQRGQAGKWALKHTSNGTLDTSSPNTWLVHRDDFFAVGSYAEHYAGAKGWSDCTLQDVFQASFKVQLRPDLWAHFHSTKDVPDAMVTSLDRSTSTNKKKRIKDTEKARKMGGWARWAKARRDVPRLNFPWVQVFPLPASSGG